MSESLVSPEKVEKVCGYNDEVRGVAVRFANEVMGGGNLTAEKKESLESESLRFWEKVAQVLVSDYSRINPDLKPEDLVNVVRALGRAVFFGLSRYLEYGMPLEVRLDFYKIISSRQPPLLGEGRYADSFCHDVYRAALLFCAACRGRLDSGMALSALNNIATEGAERSQRVAEIFNKICEQASSSWKKEFPGLNLRFVQTPKGNFSLKKIES